MRTKGIMATETHPVTGTLWLTIPTSHAVAEMLRNVYLPRTTIDDNAAHLRDCWNAIEAIGGEPAVVGEALRLLKVFGTICENQGAAVAIVKASPVMGLKPDLDALLAKIPEPKK